MNQTGLEKHRRAKMVLRSVKMDKTALNLGDTIDEQYYVTVPTTLNTLTHHQKYLLRTFVTCTVLIDFTRNHFLPRIS